MAAEPGRSTLVLRVGDEVELEVGAVAHGGHCVARVDSRVIFVRHALPGEQVVARVTEIAASGRFARADAVRVVHPSAERVDAPCRYAGPGRCGGCDWQHAALAYQRSMKADVVREQLARLAGIDRVVTVEPLPGRADGTGWRTRVQLAIAPDGRAGLRRHRSHTVEPVDRCLIAAPTINDSGALGRRWPGTERVDVVCGDVGEPVVLADGTPVSRAGRVTHAAAGREWRVSGAGFWQVHPAAADTLASAVHRLAGVVPGDRALDLFSGVGLFAAVLADLVGDAGAVTAVEQSAAAVRDARRNLHDLPQVRLVCASVDEWIRRPGVPPADVVVLDPPRSGARRAVVDAIARLSPRTVVYVACDPAALARDIALFAEHGYELGELAAYDCFPHTHHVECVAELHLRASTGR